MTRVQFWCALVAPMPDTGHVRSQNAHRDGASRLYWKAGCVALDLRIQIDDACLACFQQRDAREGFCDARNAEACVRIDGHLMLDVCVTERQRKRGLATGEHECIKA